MGENIIRMFTSKTVLIEPQTHLRTLLAQNLQVYCDTDVTFRSNTADVVELLRKDHNFQLIICAAKIGDENTVLKLFYFLQSLHLKIPIIGLGENARASASKIEMIPYPEGGGWKIIIKKAAKFLKVDPETMMRKRLPDYFPVYIKNLFNLEIAPCFIYLNIHNQYNVIFDAGEEIDKDIVKRLFLKGVKTVHVEKSWRLSFVNAVSDKLIGEFQRATTRGEHMDVLAKAIGNTQELIRLTGVTEQSIRLANQSMSSMREVAKNSEGLSDLLAILEEDSDSYAYKHCMMTNIVAYQTIKNMPWGNKVQHEKISFICFFHDITIPENNLCDIYTEEALMAADISEEDRRRVKNHAVDAVKLLKDYPQIPFGVDSLILQHHGMSNGVGFTNSQNISISPIAITFRICEEVAHMILKVGKKFNMDLVMDKLLEKYNRKQYREVVHALSKVKV